jgi:hypothetical protein
MLLGALTKEMSSSDLPSLWQTTPLQGQSFNTMCEKVRLMKSGPWHHTTYDRHSCNLNTAMNLIVDSAIAAAGGLKLRKRSAREWGAN